MADDVTPVSGIKELKELFVGLGLLVSTYKDAMKDGKIDLQDLPVLVSLATNSKQLVDAFQGLQDVGDEIKNMSKESALELISEIFDLVSAVKA